MGRLQEKVALITGAATGQGASHARRFVQEGAKVIVTDINEEAGNKLSDELGEDAIFVKHDVSSANEWKNAIEKGEKAFGAINVLINNAGFSINNRVENVTEEEYRKVIDANQVGVFLGMKAVLPSMKKAEGGSIINVASINGLAGFATSISYDSAKFAVTGMTKSAALDWVEYGIRVNSVHPGPIDTAFTESGDPEDVQAYQNMIPMGRFGEAEEVTNLMVYLASDESSFSTGSEFTLDGGIMASP